MEINLKNLNWQVKMKLKPYPKYKDSEIQWIGGIPEGWKLSKGKFQFKVTGGYAFPSDDFVDEEVPLIRIGDITKGTVNLDNCKKLPEEYTLSKKDFLLKEKDVLVAMTGATIGKIGQVPKTEIKMLLNQRVGRIKTNLSSDFYKYVLDSDFIQTQIRLIAEGSAQENISSEQIESFIIPDLNEKNQEFIVNFLDKKTSELNKTIEKDKKLIALLKEKRTALINHVVTKGLDPNAKMKRVTHDLIEKIPENWDIMALKHIVSRKITDGPHETPDFLDKGIPFISAEAIKQDKIDFTKMRGYISEELHKIYCTKCKPKKDDVFLVKSGATTGNVAIVESDEEFSIWSPLALIRSDKQKLLPKLLYYILLSDYFKKTVELSWSFGTQQNIGMSVIENLSIIVPEIKEQKILLEILEKQTSKIDKAIKLIEQKINLLEEYKKSLIHHVVTGKVDVRGVEA